MLRVSRTTGLNGLVMRSRWRQNRLLILGWHGTSLDDEHEWNPELYVSAAFLQHRLELIHKAGCNVLPLDEAVRLLDRGGLPPRAVALTVDDGCFDFYRAAFPVFQGFGFPVTVYLTTYYAEFGRPVYNGMACYLLWKGRGRILHWPAVLGPSAVELCGPAIAETGGRLIEYASARGLSGQGKDNLLHELAERLEVDYASILERRIMQLMNRDEVRELAARGVNFQLHTHRHRVPLDRQLFERELADNRVWLSRAGLREASHFCYPSGVYCTEFLPWLRDAGIVSATTCDVGMASRGANPLLLPRLMDSTGISEDYFAAWLSGIAAVIPRRSSRGAEEGRILDANVAAQRAAAASAQGV